MVDMWQLLVSKGPSSSSVATQPPVNKSAPTTSDWNHMPTTTALQPESVSYATETGVEATEESFGVDEGQACDSTLKAHPYNMTYCALVILFSLVWIFQWSCLIYAFYHFLLLDGTFEFCS